MNKPVAVMDLGTNTFHLLIGEWYGNEYKEILRRQDAVKLGEGGINKGIIQPEAFERGIKAMVAYHKLILTNKVQQVRAIATSALRSAANGQHFINEVKLQTGITIEIIDGNAEATYIYKGVKAGGCLSTKNNLIVDIGGGSVEFIICSNDQIKWKQSFEIGAARLMDNYHRTDPIPPESITALNFYLHHSLKDLFAAVLKYGITNILGSSGVFETYAGIIEMEKDRKFDLKNSTCYEFEKNELLALIEKLILSSHQMRLANINIIPVRIDMIVTASILTRFLIEELRIDKISMSTNSLKEGILAEILENLQE